MFPSEKAWLPTVLEPVRKAYMMQPQPLQLFLPEEPLPEDAQVDAAAHARPSCHPARPAPPAPQRYPPHPTPTLPAGHQVAYLTAKQPSQAGVWLEVFAYRARRMVHVYRIESHGRRRHRSLIYTSDARYCLRTMQPKIDHRTAPWPSWARHEAGHPYDVPEPAPSAVITREATVPENLSFGEETFLPQRLLWGLLPAALLERYVFWQDESDLLRGYPRDPKHPNIIFVNLGVGGHVALHGARFEQVKRGDTTLAPARALVLRLQRSRLERQHRAVNDALAVLEEFMKDRGLLSVPFESSFALCGGVAALLRKLGRHTFGAGTDETIARDLETIRGLLPLVSLVPFQRRRKRHRVPKVVVPALLDALDALVEARGGEGREAEGGGAAAGGGRGGGAAPSGAMSASDFDEEELVLLDLLHAPPDTYLYSLATVLSRVENLSHLLAWASYDDEAALGAPETVSQADLRVVSLPRLKLTFQALHADNTVRLFSVDHADLFITNVRNETSAMLAGMPHSLLLSNSNDEMSVLVPAWPPVRPQIEAMPFSTELVLDRTDLLWTSQLEHPYYMYPVHVSLSFLYSTTLASAMYLMLLRYLNRQYAAVVRLADTIGTDTALTREEDNSLQFTTCLNTVDKVQKNSLDYHPDATAARLKISVVMLDAPLRLPWDLSVELGHYLFLLEHVSADCMLSAEEELSLLKSAICDGAPPHCGAHHPPLPCAAAPLVADPLTPPCRRPPPLPPSSLPLPRLCHRPPPPLSPPCHRRSSPPPSSLLPPRSAPAATRTRRDRECAPGASQWPTNASSRAGTPPSA